MTRLPSLVGERDERGRPLAPLSVDLERVTAAGTRRRVLTVLAEQPAGTAVATAGGVAAVLSWLTPRRGGQRAEVVAGLLTEAEVLGVTGLGAMTSYGRVLLAGEDPAPALTARLPEPVDHVLVQADLTVIAPGPLEVDLAREMALVADVESAGGATAYRLSAGTVRRALDAGRTASELHDLFRARSRTAVPQALSYLIDDVARRHGVLRVGSASAYLRCDDEALLAQVVGDRRVESLRLRRIAATVATSRSAAGRVLEVLRQAGYAPVGESADGGVEISRPEVRRAADRPAGARMPGEPPPPTDAALAQIVRGIRAGDRAARQAHRVAVGATPGHPPAEDGGAAMDWPPGTGADQPSAAVLAVLRQAIGQGRPVLLGYVNAQGSASNRIVDPASVNGGYLHGYDHRREEMRTFAVHRITTAAMVEDGEEPPAPRGEA